MEIKAKDVMTLRQQTGAGMMDCKKALAECRGDIESAVKYLREKGLLAAKKRADRVAKEGTVVIRSNEDRTVWAIVEVNCETDFVARNEEFIALADQLAMQALKLDVLKAQNQTIPLEAFDLSGLKAFAGKVGENLSMSRAAVLYRHDNNIVESYIHPGSQLGVIVEVQGDASAIKSNAASELAHDLALQIAAAAPLYIKRDEVPPEVLEKEKEIYINQMRNEGKPEAILEKIAIGKLNKFFEDNCLIEQLYVKEAKQKVSQRIAEGAKAANGALYVSQFIRFKVGDSR